MKVKVCGMKDPDNIRELLTLPIDYIGFIFYDKSPRFAGETKLTSIRFPRRVKKTGVFVNHSIPEIASRIKSYDLDSVQLHGDETPETCKILRQAGLEVLKVFRIAQKEDLDACMPYVPVCDYFLFDTQTDIYGGSGKHFDWNILKNYREEIPFFLSGGIAPEDADRICTFNHPLCCGVDLNSRFEQSPGYKDIGLINGFLKQLKK